MRKLLAMILIAAAAFALPAGARAQNTLTMQPPAEYMINGVRIFDSNSKNPMDSTTYLLGTGRSVTLQLGAPRDTGYNFTDLQTYLARVPQCGKDDLAVACLRGSSNACGSLSPHCLPRSGYLVTNQGACNSNISPANGKIVLSLSCPAGPPCSCSITEGQQIASQADKACPFTCQAYNPANGSCAGAPVNGCGTPVRPDPPAPKCPFTCQFYSPASNSCVGAHMNGC